MTRAELAVRAPSEHGREHSPENKNMSTDIESSLRRLLSNQGVIVSNQQLLLQVLRLVTGNQTKLYNKLEKIAGALDVRNPGETEALAEAPAASTDTTGGIGIDLTDVSAAHLDDLERVLAAVVAEKARR